METIVEVTKFSHHRSTDHSNSSMISTENLYHQKTIQKILGPILEDPDLNAIENIWSILKLKVSAWPHLKFAPWKSLKE